MELGDLVLRLREKSISLYEEDGRLRARAPQGALDGELQQALADHSQQLREMVRGRSVSRAYVPRDRPDPLPLSFGQARLWFLDQIGGGAGYNMPAVLRVRGSLDVDLVERSLNAIVARHEALRTTFPAPDGRPQQVVARRLKIRVRAEELADRLVQEEIARPFDLAEGPLLRAVVAEVAPDEHLVVLTLHHIVADGWSMRIFIREMGLFYASLADGRPVELPPLPVQYPDYAIAQRERAEDERATADIAFWKAALEGAPEGLELPFDRPHPPAQRFLGGVVRTTIEPGLRERLTTFASARGATPLQVLLAAYATLLHRYGGQDDMVIGVPLANRERPEIAELIGFFVNTLPVRLRFAGDPGFDAVLEQAMQGLRAGVEHLEAPFERIVEALNPQRSASRTPLVQTMFGFQESPTAQAAVPGVDLEILPVHNGTSKFDLTVLMEDGPDGVEAAWEFDSDVFDQATVERMAANFEVLLDAVCADAAQPVSRLPLPAAAERTTLLEAWAGTATAFPAARRVEDLFREQARSTPDAIAVKDGPSALSYGDLDRRSDALAAALTAAGLERGQHVGVCCDPSEDLFVALVAVVKAGGSYLPIAMSDPEPRIELVLADAGVSLAVAQPRYHDLLARTAPGARLLAPDAVAPVSGRTEPPEAGDAEDPLYLIYTSGSTGVPKGVIVPHRAVTRLVYGQEYLDFAAGHTFAQWSNPCFDAFTLEVWGALLHGGTVVCTPPEVLLEPAALARHIRDEGVSAGFLTASLFNEVARRHPTAFASMDTLLVGGEALTPRWLAEVLAHGPPRRLLNGYGPTETTTFACWHEIGAVDPDAASVPIGRPLANTTAYVLDAWGEPAPVGARGELLIGGPGVALGYHDRPELTADRFVANPFGPGRLYRTGDQASWSGDGALRYHGRLDGQVKVRGHRVELGEVEHALVALDDVGQAVVTVHRLEAGHLQLVAYVVGEGAADPAPEALAEQLRARLPAYMVPARWVLLDRLPLTPSGKVDRGALPPPGQPVAAEHDARSLDGEAEAILAEIWEEVLGVEGVRPGDNFFALGGDSILGIQVAARAQARGVTVSARQVVSSRDLTELATLSAAALRIDAEQGQVTGDVPLTPIQRWFFGLGPAEPARFTQSVLLALAPDVDPEALRAAVMALPERHDALRLRYRNIGSGEPQQFHGELEGAATFDVRERTDVERQGAELKAGMDLEHGPLFRAALFAGGPADEPARLLLAAHHLVVDAVSWRILIEDLISVYVQVVPGNSMTSPIKTTSYKAWSEALQGWPADTDIVAEAERWVALAAGPEDPRHGAARTPAATAQVAFDRADTSRLLEAPLASYAIALHEMLLAALSTSPTLAGGQPAVRIDLEGHGRDDLFATVDVSRTVGWFTAQYPVRLDAAEGAAPRDVLLAVKERLRSVAHGGIGWGLLQDAPVEVAPACVRFNYLGRIDSTVAGGVVLGLADDPTGPDWPQDAAIFHPLEIEAEVLDGCLGVRLTGRTAAFDAATLASIASELESTLRAFARHFEELSAPVYSPSDFPDVELGQDELDALVTQLGAAGLDL